MTGTSDEVIDKAWGDVGPGDRVRWALPQSIQYGVVLERKGQSLVVSLWDSHTDERPKTIPDARWYFVQGKANPNAEEHLVVVKDAGKDPIILRRPHTDGPGLVTVKEAIELLQMDPKQLRRHIRKGKIVAYKNKHDQWVMQRDQLMDAAAKHGWI